MEKARTPTLCIVAPCYNEEEVVMETVEALSHSIVALVQKGIIAPESFIGLVDDGSRDKTWELILRARQKNPSLRAIRLRRNYGHQRALIAGLQTFCSEADALISIDADLQDDVRVIPEMVQKYGEGNDIVYGVRNKRDHDSWFKKNTAQFFYALMRMLGVSIVYNHADFRLTSKKVILALKEYSEENIFLRGIFPAMGFRSANVYYNRIARKAGTSKYPFFAMLNFAWEGITSFSIKPLRLVTIMGFLVFGVSISVSAYVIFARYYLQVVHGWASTVLPIYLLGGIQLLAIGIIGEYLGKIYQEVKHRPRYSIAEEL